MSIADDIIKKYKENPSQYQQTSVADTIIQKYKESKLPKPEPVKEPSIFEKTKAFLGEKLAPVGEFLQKYPSPVDFIAAQFKPQKTEQFVGTVGEGLDNQRIVATDAEGKGYTQKQMAELKMYGQVKSEALPIPYKQPEEPTTPSVRTAEVESNVKQAYDKAREMLGLIPESDTRMESYYFEPIIEKKNQELTDKFKNGDISEQEYIDKMKSNFGDSNRLKELMSEEIKKDPALAEYIDKRNANLMDRLLFFVGGKSPVVTVEKKVLKELAGAGVKDTVRIAEENGLKLTDDALVAISKAKDTKEVQNIIEKDLKATSLGEKIEYPKAEPEVKPAIEKEMVPEKKVITEEVTKTAEKPVPETKVVSETTVPTKKISSTAINSIENDASGIKPGAVERAKTEIQAGKSYPVTVRELEDGKLFIEDGRHRIQAYKELGISDVPIKDVTPQYTNVESQALKKIVQEKESAIAKAEMKQPDVQLEKTLTTSEKKAAAKEKLSAMQDIKKKIVDSFINSEEGRQVSAKIEKAILQNESVAADLNKEVFAGIKNNPYYRKEKAISDELATGYLMKKGNKTMVIPQKDVERYVGKGWKRGMEIDSLAHEAGFENGQDYLNYQLELISDKASLSTPERLAHDMLMEKEPIYKKLNETIYETKRQIKELAKSQKEARETIKRAKEEVAGLPEKRESEFAKRLNQDLPENLKIDEEYSVAHLKGEANKAADLIRKDKDRAIRIATGLEKSDANTQTAVSIALAEKAKLEGDWQTVADLYSSRRLANTRRGQEIAMEKLSVKLNPEEIYMRQVVDARLNGVKLGSEDIIRAISKESKKERVFKRIKNQSESLKNELTNAVKLDKAQKVFNELICK